MDIGWQDIQAPFLFGGRNEKYNEMWEKVRVEQ